MATHPAGTRIGAIRSYDRSTKVVFQCPDHPQKTWRSKDPRISTWFLVSDETPMTPPCGCMIASHVTVEEYTEKAA